MAQIVVRKLDEDVKARLRQRAVKNGRSLEAEVRTILTEIVSNPTGGEEVEGLGTSIARRFVGIGLRPGEELPKIDWSQWRPVEFDE